MKRLAWVWILALALSLGNTLAPGSSRSTLVGFFDFDPAELNEVDPIEAAVRLQVFNLNSEKVFQGLLAFEALEPPGKTLWSFGRQDIEARGYVEIEQTVRIPRREYDRWLDGQTPLLYAIDDRDDPPRRVRVYLHRTPLRPEPKP